MPNSHTNSSPKLRGWSLAAAVIGLALVTAILFPSHPSTAGDVPAVDIEARTDGVSMVFSALTGRDVLLLDVRAIGPDHFIFEHRAEAATLSWIPPDELPDGLYRWEARVVTVEPGAPMREIPAGAHDFDIERGFYNEHKQTHVSSGTFQVENAVLAEVSQTTAESGSGSALAVTGTGVGIGTTTPLAPLHVMQTDGTAEILIEETAAIDINQQFVMRHNGNTGFKFENTSDGAEWQFRTGGPSGAANAFLISRVGTGQSELNLNQNGNLTIRGQLFTGSSRDAKMNISDVDVDDLVTKLEAISLQTWSYASAPSQTHIGPMAEDFNELFGFGGSAERISPSDLASISLVATQELLKRNRELVERNKEFEKKNKEFEARLQALESQLTAPGTERF